MDNLKPILFALACALTANPYARAGTLTVTSAADSGGGTLRAQIAASSPGDTIIFSASLSGGSITLTSGQIEITNNLLTVDGSTLSSMVALSGNNVSRLLQIDAGASVTLKSMIFENGTELADFGGAIKNDGSLTVLNCSFISNSAKGGNGVSCGGDVQSAGGGGGGGGGFGGAIFSDGPTLSLASCVFSNNLAQGGTNGDNHPFTSWIGDNGTGYGGAIFDLSPSLTITNNIFTNNTASTGLADVYRTPQLTMTITNGALQFSWPTNETGFSVELTTDLTSSNWQPLTNAINVSGGLNVQTTAPTPGFFRLFYANAPLPFP